MGFYLTVDMEIRHGVLQELQKKPIIPSIIETRDASTLRDVRASFSEYYGMGGLLTERPGAVRAASLLEQGLAPRDLAQFGPAALRSAPLITFRTISRFNMFAAPLTDDLLGYLEGLAGVENVYLNRMNFILGIPVVPNEGVYVSSTRKEYTTTSWTKALLGLDALEGSYSGSGVRLAVLDTGGHRRHTQIRHSAFASAMVDKGQAFDKNGHGTWCASCAGGKRARDDITKTELVGMAPGATMLNVMCLGFVVGMGMTDDIIEAVSIAVDWDAKVISMSLGSEGTPPSPDHDPMTPVLRQVVAEERIPCIAAGNSGPSSRTVGMPGGIPEVLTVGAYDPITGKVAEFSSRGPTSWGETKPDVSSYGVMIHSGIGGMLAPVNEPKSPNYTPISGTSMSTPHVAGTIAVFEQVWREKLDMTLTVEEIKAMMQKLGHGKNNNDGWGLIDAEKFLMWLSTEYGEEL